MTTYFIEIDSGSNPLSEESIEEITEAVWDKLFGNPEIGNEGACWFRDENGDVLSERAK